LTHAIDHHFNRGEPGIDRRFVFGRFPGPMSNLGSLDVSALLLDQGWLLFEADLHHMDQNSLNVTEDEN
jgi:hypothetical protein